MNVITQKLVQVLENRKAKSQHGFTLLELLVVVATLMPVHLPLPT
ncbi:MAG: hypothetical protein CSA21_07010 [Deltaproteobacteria bacterium]|nr:MAG: hypothetical protein CSA21_07010 [Deltaproteobacteria bacterium]